eukprot:scaffold13684_cov178-Isochrysis_galbana.AAC.2
MRPARSSTAGTRSAARQLSVGGAGGASGSGDVDGGVNGGGGSDVDGECGSGVGCGGGSGGSGGMGGEGAGDSRGGRPPSQSRQSVPYSHPEYCEPGPPSSQKPSEPHDGCPMQSFEHNKGVDGGGAGESGADGGEGGGDSRGGRPPSQSRQSVPYSHPEYCEPGPPSSQ